MPIDFFAPECRSESDSERFGLCDDPPPDTNPDSLRPLAHAGQQANIQKFKDDTGLTLKGTNIIVLE